MLPLSARVGAADRAAELGVLSAAALVDLHGALWDATDASERSGLLGERLRAVYLAGDDTERVSALRGVWGTADTVAYARQIASARASALITPSTAFARADVDRLIAAMLSSGLDIQAARWSGNVENGSLAQALLAVGAPRAVAGFGAAEVRELESGDDLRAKFLMAGLAGLGRLSEADTNELAQRYSVAVGRADSWTRALDRAVAARAPAAVAVLAATGMQTGKWSGVPPHALYHIVRALRAVGLEPEARMIATEAVARAPA